MKSITIAKVDNFLFKLSLIIVGLITFYLIVLVKSRTTFALAYFSPVYLYTIAITTFQMSRLVGAIMFGWAKKSTAINTTSTQYQPSVTFVIPCKNEEQAIANTITKCFAADYPKNKIEVIVINDGSTDNTIKVLKKLKQKYPQLVIVDWKKNRGKRHGMTAGFKLAKGEIVVQLDSDSYIDPKSFKNLITPFANPDIGAVCAHADPANADTNWLTKMQAAYYFMSFRILKAAESTFSKVFCCSGCSSAYRRSLVIPILDQWLNETFLGSPVTWGDDRSLTNWVLKLGYKTIYTNDVQAYTICPDNFKQFLKQQIRWKKSWFVNSVFASKFIVKRDPFVAFTYFFPLIIITLITPFIAVRALIFNPIVHGIAPWFYIAGVYLVATIMTVYYRYVARTNRYWPYIFVWSSVNLVFLSFILFYSLATIQNRKWGTR